MYDWGNPGAAGPSVHEAGRYNRCAGSTAGYRPSTDSSKQPARATVLVLLSITAWRQQPVSHWSSALLRHVHARPWPGPSIARHDSGDDQPNYLHYITMLYASSNAHLFTTLADAVGKSRSLRSTANDEKWMTKRRVAAGSVACSIMPRRLGVTLSPSLWLEVLRLELRNIRNYTVWTMSVTLPLKSPQCGSFVFIRQTAPLCSAANSVSGVKLTRTRRRTAKGSRWKLFRLVWFGKINIPDWQKVVCLRKSCRRTKLRAHKVGWSRKNARFWSKNRRFSLATLLCP